MASLSGQCRSKPGYGGNRHRRIGVGNSGSMCFFGVLAAAVLATALPVATMPMALSPHLRRATAEHVRSANGNASAEDSNIAALLPLPDGHVPIPGCRPSFFILGARKGGTTSMYHYLTSHPQVRSLVGFGGDRSLPQFGEVHFFGMQNQWERGLAWYNAQFPELKSGEISGESSVDTLVSGLAPTRMLEACGPNLRFFVLLRDPVERFHSNFLMRIRMGTLPVAITFTGWIDQHMTAFRKAEAAHKDWLAKNPPVVLFQPSINMLYEGIYYVHLRRWFKTFPLSAAHWRLYFSEEFFTNPADTIDDALHFLGVEPGLVDTAEITHKSYNTRDDKGGVVLKAHHNMLEEDRDTLAKFYAPFNRLLGSLLRRKIPDSWSQ